MDQDLPERDFWPPHPGSLAQAGTFSEDEPPRQGAGKILWLTLLASLLVHAILLAMWTARPTDVEAVAPKPSLGIVLKTTVADTDTATAEPEPEPEQEPSAREEPSAEEKPSAVEEPEQESPPPEDTSATEEVAQDNPRIEIRAQDIAPDHQAGPSTRESDRDNVFHPGLRGQISDARTRRERLHNTETHDLPSWQDGSGDTWVDLGNGTCMRSAGNTQGTRTDWELPTRCRGQLTEGETMLRSMQRRLDRR